MHCPNCSFDNLNMDGHEIEGLKYCMKCGESIVICKSCKSDLRNLKDPTFCPFCGKSIPSQDIPFNLGHEYDPRSEEVQILLTKYPLLSLEDFALEVLQVPGRIARSMGSTYAPKRTNTIERLLTLSAADMGASGDGIYGVGKESAVMVVKARREYMKRVRQNGGVNELTDVDFGPLSSDLDPNSTEVDQILREISDQMEEGQFLVALGIEIEDITWKPRAGKSNWHKLLLTATAADLVFKERLNTDSVLALVQARRRYTKAMRERPAQPTEELGPEFDPTGFEIQELIAFYERKDDDFWIRLAETSEAGSQAIRAFESVRNYFTKMNSELEALYRGETKIRRQLVKEFRESRDELEQPTPPG